MASREKKIVTTGRKQTPTPSSNDPTQDPQQSEKPSESTSPSKKPITKRIRRPDPKKVIKKTFKRPLKAKNKITNRNILAKNKRNVKVKKALIKNGVAKARVVKRKVVKVPEIKEEKVEWDEKPPVLEPIYPLDNTKKKVLPGKKKPAGFCSISDAIESSIRKGLLPVKTTKAKEKIKKSTAFSSIESIVESIEGVVNSIKIEDVDEEEDNKETIPKLEEEDDKSKIPKLEKQESTLSVIDMLDLNVGGVKNKASVSKRRHSIEKFEITTNQDDSVFNNLPRCLSPKIPKKPLNKARPSLDSRRSSPYTTRSDSPARILRNGKQRKLKHMNLLDGLDSGYKKRRRLCSDYSGSEVSVSKCSGGYESDSSFSDLASLAESSEVTVKKEPIDLTESNKEETGDRMSALKKELTALAVSNDSTSKELALKIKNQLAALAKNTEELTKTSQVLSKELALRKELAALAKSNEAMAKELAALTENADLGLCETTSEELALKKELLETLENNPPDSIDIDSIPEKFATTIRRSLSLEKEKTFDTNSNLCSENVKSEEGSESQQPEKVILLDIMKQTFNENEGNNKEDSSDTVILERSSDNEENKSKSSDVEEIENNRKFRLSNDVEETEKITRRRKVSSDGENLDKIKRKPSLVEEERISRKSSFVDEEKLGFIEEETLQGHSSLMEEDENLIFVEEEIVEEKTNLLREERITRKSSLAEGDKTNLVQEISKAKSSLVGEETPKRKSSLIEEEKPKRKSSLIEEDQISDKSSLLNETKSTLLEDKKIKRKSSLIEEDKIKTRLSLSEESEKIKTQTSDNEEVERNTTQVKSSSDNVVLEKKKRSRNSSDNEEFDRRKTRSKETLDNEESERRKGRSKESSENDESEKRKGRSSLEKDEIERKKCRSSLEKEEIERRKCRSRDSLENEEIEKRKGRSKEALEIEEIEKRKGRSKDILSENEEVEKRRSRTKESLENEEIERRKTRSKEILEIEEKRKTRSSLKKNQNEETKEEIEEKPVLTHESEEDSQDKENYEINKVEQMVVEEAPEDLEVKNEILRALGLQSLRAAEEAKLRKVVPKNESYTGTLKTVIKLNRHEKKKGRNSLKMTLQKKGKSSSGAGGSGSQDDLDRVEEDEYKIMKEGNSSWKSHHGNNSSDTAGAQRKSHYYNRSNMDGSSEHTSDGDTNAAEEGKSLVIPEKASSFSIHPGRLCKDECSYCFGKFGLFDTPCHIAQIKSIDRQNKILSTEKHLTRDSCLCDACYRHVDRKSNTPSYTSNKSLKRNSLVAPGPRQNHCHVLGCGRVSSNILKRKWLIKMRKSVCQVINIDLDNPGLHSIPICEEHYAALEHLMVCAMCKRRLARNHIHYLGQESNDLNAALNEMGIPVKLNDKPVVCKLCRYFATLVLKNPEDRNESSANFFVEYRKRLLHFHDIEVMDESLAEEPIPAPIKEKPEKDQQAKKKKKPSSKTSINLEPPVLEPQVDLVESKEPPDTRVPSTESRETSPSEYLDYNNLILPENNVEITRKKPQSITVKRVINISSNSVVNVNSKTDDESRKFKDETRKFNEESRKFSNDSWKFIDNSRKRDDDSLKFIDESKKFIDSRKLKLKSDIAVQRLGSNPSISVRQLFPGEEDLQLSGNIEFHNVKERTPEGWEKCVSTIQFDPEVKMLWNELQKPYGNQSSFLRHLILLEKYFRNGDLIMSSSATNHSVNYTESVQNRLRAYDNIPSEAANVKPITLIPFNSGKVKEAKPVPAAIPIVETLTVPPPELAVSVAITTTPTVTEKVSPVTISQVTDKVLPVTISQVTDTVLPVTISQVTDTVLPVTISQVTDKVLPVTNSQATDKVLPVTISQVTEKVLPVTISQVQVTNSSFLVPNPVALITTPAAAPVIPLPPPPPPPAPPQPSIRPTSKLPPGLISLQPGTKRPLVKPQQSQKIKFPITKHWRPNLIPVDSAKKTEKKPGLVQVISGGKPYHISIEDYKKMCAIKRTFDLRQKRLQDQQKNSLLKNSRKNLIITKTSFDDSEIENSLEKLDKTVEKLEASLSEKNLPMPKIPKSLTVIPQTVTKKVADPTPSTSLLKSKLPAGKS